MSYILDALKRADAERERVGVPGLHAQPDAAAALEREPGRRSLGRWIAIGLLLAAVLAALAWRWFAATPEPSLTPPQAPAANLPPPAPAPSPLVAPVAQPEPAPAAGAVQPPAPADVAAPKPQAVPAQPTPAAAAANRGRPTALADLPADVRRALPALAVGGSMYSTNAAQRMVILNGQVFREGDPLAEGLSVEQIGLKSTVLAFRGYRIELKH